MQFLGVGPLEFVFILILAVIVLGPKGMVDAARRLGKFIRKVKQSTFWSDVMQTSQEIRDFPRKIMDEVGAEEEIKEIEKNLSEQEHILTLDQRKHDPNIKPPRLNE